MPHPRDAVPAVVAALREVFDADLRCAILKGSVLKGDWIPYFSDLDVHAFADGVGEDRSVHWSTAVALQERIGRIDPEPYLIHDVQLMLFGPAGYGPDMVPPPPGTYEVLYGAIPESFHRPQVVETLAVARANLARLPEHVATMNRGFWDKPDPSAGRFARLAGVYLKGALYDAGKLITNEPAWVLSLPRDELIALVGPVVGNEREVRAYYDRALEWHEVRERPERLREMYGLAMAALEAIVAWATRLK